MRNQRQLLSLFPYNIHVFYFLVAFKMFSLPFIFQIVIVMYFGVVFILFTLLIVETLETGFIIYIKFKNVKTFKKYILLYPLFLQGFLYVNPLDIFLQVQSSIHVFLFLCFLVFFSPCFTLGSLYCYSIQVHRPLLSKCLTLFEYLGEVLALLFSSSS